VPRVRTAGGLLRLRESFAAPPAPRAVSLPFPLAMSPARSTVPAGRLAARRLLAARRPARAAAAELPRPLLRLHAAPAQRLPHARDKPASAPISRGSLCVNSAARRIRRGTACGGAP
jgi:hypothetical protein